MKKLLTILLLLTICIPAKSSHLLGGEITWECIKSGINAGKFIFKVKLFRDCNGVPGPQSVLLYTNAPGLGAGIPCSLISLTDISPQGTGCPSCSIPLGLSNAVQEFIFQSAPISIIGVPPSTGWYFAFSDCCRSNLITNLSPNGSGYFTLRSIMYPYQGNNTSTCYDSSPQFAERPLLAACSTDTIYYNSGVIDQEQDSLVFSWDSPLDGFTFSGSFNYQFAPGYSFTNPYPDTLFNPLNIPAKLFSENGIVQFKSVNTGVFISTIRISSYRCGIKLADVFREMQLAVTNNCQLPNVPPFNGQINHAPIVTDGFSKKYNNYKDTLIVGDSVVLDFFAQDFEISNVGPPHPNQKIALSATGLNFGQNFTSTQLGCPFPPCAVIQNFNNQPTSLIDTVTPILPNYLPLFFSFRFRWQTDCGHLKSASNCPQKESIHSYILKVADDFCPTQASNWSTLTFLVKAPTLPPVRIKCVNTDSTGKVNILFQPGADLTPIDSLDQLKGFNIYRSTTGINGNYQFLDSLPLSAVSNPDTLINYTDTNVTGVSGQLFYRIHTLSGCSGIETSQTDVFTNMTLTTTPSAYGVQLNWAAIFPTQTSNGSFFQVWRELPAGSGNWTVVATTTTASYFDSLPNMNDTLNYYISVTDSTGGPCESKTPIKTQVVNVNVSLPELSMLQQSTLFPNPGYGHYGIRFNAEVPASVTIRVRSTSGGLIHEFTKNGISPGDYTSLDLSNMKAGVYFIELMSHGFRVIHKLIQMNP